ncbi:hypothetical protein Btru_008080 [Bulinus truncatus]|nr:hypothetical protein Btru_008080 [Bulinus truncatus]
MQSSSNFTVEQVELIRRLRNSGITQHQIIEAFQAYDRLEQELGDLYSFPINRNAQNLYIRSSEVTTSNQSSQHLDNSRTIPTKTKINNGANSLLCQEPLPQYKSEITKPPSDKFILYLLSLGKENLVDLVRRCQVSLSLSDLRQQIIELGVGEMPLHLFLSGDLHSIEPNIRHRLLEWFVEKLKQTDWFLEEFPHLSSYQDYTDGLDVHFTPRRERFTFKEKHLEILEMFFKGGQYPSQEEKEHIANECNIAMANEVHRSLGEKERMTHINVSNWFSNRRKEIKRLAKKDGIDTEKVILPSRVKAKGLTYSIPLDEQMEEKYVDGVSLSTNLLVQGEAHSETDSSLSQDSCLQQACQNHSLPHLDPTFDPAPDSSLHDPSRGNSFYLPKHFKGELLNSPARRKLKETLVTVKTEPAD